MIKTVGIAVWAALVALGTNFGVSAWQQKKAAAAAAPPPAAGSAEATEVRKARHLNIPVVHGGEVQGYVIVQLSFVQDSVLQKAAGFDPEPFLLDETFRILYSDRKLELRNIERYDLDSLRKHLLERIRTRLRGDMVRDVMLQEFNYVLKSDIRQ